MRLDLASHLPAGWPRAAYHFAAPVIDRSLWLGTFEGICRDTCLAYQGRPDAPSAFAWFDSALDVLGARVEATASADGVNPLPAEGPVVVVSNHPFGLLDPVALGWWLAKRRPDLKIMANSLLGSIPEMAPYLIQVDPFAAEDSARRNLRPLKEAVRHLTSGGVLAVFPSGEVAHWRAGEGIRESPWSSHVAALARRSGASVLPVHVAGANSLLFHAAGLVHPRLRTGLLPRELACQRGSTVRLRIGTLLPPGKLARFSSDEKLTSFLRLATLLPGDAGRPSRGFPSSPLGRIRSRWHAARREEIAPAGCAAAIAEEIASLRRGGACLASQGKLSVFAATAPELPSILPELGRLREQAFREVGEGTGKSRDLDHCDAYYWHLFLWDEQQQRLAGAYRMGQADVILRERGPAGLYTSSLFKFSPPFLGQLCDALELGRSFICPGWQRDLAALPLLWRGIGRWIADRPSYRKLFGPVSISRDYHPLSRRVMVEILRRSRMDQELSGWVRPRRPFRERGDRFLRREIAAARLDGTEGLSDLIAALEADGKGLPVLMKHYLKLHGTLLGFSVDPGFSSSLDGLILVDLALSDSRLVSRYMGTEACQRYLARHRGGRSHPEQGLD